ncbi:uncharacterized protein LOC109823273 [Asparagus officinalis]|uniref:uncharacterized protein LOC109823273 n=1 Tax=Asparagus officinalis TaxID=4686 RepID=UPI00098E01BD|nr:uncharacterized protein LOC109823273 [Asparagus officinalis]
MEFARSKEGNQYKYVLDFLSETGLLGCKATEIPIKPYIKLQPAKPKEWLGEAKNKVWLLEAVHKELRSVAYGICEVLWIKRLLEGLEISNSSPTKNKHVEVDKYFIKEKIEKGLIRMSYVPITEWIADILTKGLPKKQFDNLIGKLAMEDIYKPTRGGVLIMSKI